MQDDFEIPEFLRRTNDTASQAKAEPETATPTIRTPTSWKRLDEIRKAKSRERVATMLARKQERDRRESIPQSRRRWDATHNRWVDDRA
jgi:hypothetical protein